MHSKSGGHMHLGGTINYKKGNYATYKEALYVQICGKWGNVPLCPPVPTSMVSFLRGERVLKN